MTDVGIEQLVNLGDELANIRALLVGATDTSKKAVRKLAKLNGIRWLLLNGVEIPEDGWFDQFSQLKALLVWDEQQGANPLSITVRWTQENQDAIAKLSQLRQLQLTGLDMRDIDISGLGQLPELQYLDARCHNIDADALQAIQEHLVPRLEAAQ